MRVFFEGGKNATDVILVEHVCTHERVIEVIAYNRFVKVEAPRMYLIKEVVEQALDNSIKNERIKDRTKIYNRRGTQSTIQDIIEEVTDEMVGEYVLRHIMIRHRKDEYVYSFEAMAEDDMDLVRDMELMKKPEVVTAFALPVQVTPNAAGVRTTRKLIVDADNGGRSSNTYKVLPEDEIQSQQQPREDDRTGKIGFVDANNFGIDPELLEQRLLEIQQLQVQLKVEPGNVASTTRETINVDEEELLPVVDHSTVSKDSMLPVLISDRPKVMTMSDSLKRQGIKLPIENLSISIPRSKFDDAIWMAGVECGGHPLYKSTPWGLLPAAAAAEKEAVGRMDEGTFAKDFPMLAAARMNVEPPRLNAETHLPVPRTGAGAGAGAEAGADARVCAHSKDSSGSSSDSWGAVAGGAANRKRQKDNHHKSTQHNTTTGIPSSNANAGAGASTDAGGTSSTPKKCRFPSLFVRSTSALSTTTTITTTKPAVAPPPAVRSRSGTGSKLTPTSPTAEKQNSSSYFSGWRPWKSNFKSATTPVEATPTPAATTTAVVTGAMVITNDDPSKQSVVDSTGVTSSSSQQPHEIVYSPDITSSSVSSHMAVEERSDRSQHLRGGVLHSSMSSDRTHVTLHSNNSSFALSTATTGTGTPSDSSRAFPTHVPHQQGPSSRSRSSSIRGSDRLHPISNSRSDSISSSWRRNLPSTTTSIPSTSTGDIYASSSSNPANASMGIHGSYGSTGSFTGDEEGGGGGGGGRGGGGRGRAVGVAGSWMDPNSHLSNSILMSAIAAANRAVAADDHNNNKNKTNISSSRMVSSSSSSMSASADTVYHSYYDGQGNSTGAGSSRRGISAMGQGLYPSRGAPSFDFQEENWESGNGAQRHQLTPIGDHHHHQQQQQQQQHLPQNHQQLSESQTLPPLVASAERK